MNKKRENKSGLHLRPTGELFRIVATCKSNIFLVKDEKRVNPKSVLIDNAAIKCGAEIIVECTGETEVQGLQIIIDAINSGLTE